MDNIMNTLTSRTGVVNAAPQTIVGVENLNADLKEYVNILRSHHHLYLDQVFSFFVYFMGNGISTLTMSTNMNLNAIDPNEANNLGLVNRYNICLWQLSVAPSFHFE